MRTLLVDNYDSFTFNLFQLIADVNGTNPVVVVNDDPSLATMRLAGFDNIVISPGPGRPQNPCDIGYISELLRCTTLPVLGVCLGHQAIAHAAGAVIGPAPQPRHGYLSKVKHEGTELFAGIPQEFIAVRYHSLCVDEPVPSELIVTAWADDGVIMGLRHRNRPHWGVQFHPESIASRFGRELLVNFRDLSTVANTQLRAKPVVVSSPQPSFRMAVTVLPEAVNTESVFQEFFESSPACFWLDSSRVEPGLSRFSFLGDASSPLSEVLSYRVSTGAVKVEDASGVRVESGGIFEVLERRLRDRRVVCPDLPFDLGGGYVGYFGYELKADCGVENRHIADTPDAMWIFADRLIAVDHERGRTYVLALYRTVEQREDAKDWVERTATRLAGIGSVAHEEQGDSQPPAIDPVDHLILGRHRYESDVEESKRQLIRGDSYEICLTTKLRLPFHDDDTAFYRRLRRLNSAPYAALLRVGGVTVFSSSPERFLRIERDGAVESKPIKGTARRSVDPVRDAQLAADLASSPKTQAENLMIVDLLRNDLGQVCQVGSVKVERYMVVETYSTVHQLVSTIRGRLHPLVSPVECVRRCFPGGSMTGAPKQRTMEIIDRLETEARGVYAGALGYFGLTGGADLSIVIRTAVRHGDELTIGAGGAIVLDSDASEEFEEMVLKAATPLRAVRPVTASDCVVRP